MVAPPSLLNPGPLHYPETPESNQGQAKVNSMSNTPMIGNRCLKSSKFSSCVSFKDSSIEKETMFQMQSGFSQQRHTQAGVLPGSSEEGSFYS